jgi:hypothetical protein
MTEKGIDAFAQDIIDTYTFASKSSQNETDFQKLLYSHLGNKYVATTQHLVNLLIVTSNTSKKLLSVSSKLIAK